MKRIGVLALQGAFAEHGRHIANLGYEPVYIRRPDQLFDLDAIILPGGESTAMAKHMSQGPLKARLIEAIEGGLPVWGTCAGMILLAKKLGGADSPHLALMDIDVRRNAYGRQLGSFTLQTLIPCLGENSEMVFIRAPYVEECGPSVEALLVHEGKVVAARQGRMLVTAFHPELTDSTLWLSYFLKSIAQVE